ncbi:helix-turn-helix domain-containing protein [Halobacillus campisalis]|uniref:Helix-turn-helix domain-containing protein n=1 Tax=Halobacillus campisalis TaxID=435909 RepID=A0ABW2K039_9BACI|nr:helix-turn-helix transcriptional regulator [Halobacillus campisalis]
MKGQLIKQHRKFKDMTLEELADGICSVSYLSKIENNTISASKEMYRLLGEKLNIHLENLNEEFDDKIYEKLIDWHKSIQLKNTTLMENLHEECRNLLNFNQNIELSNLFKIIHSRFQLTTTNEPLSKKITKELYDVMSQSSNEYRFLYYKTIGIDYLLQFQYEQAEMNFQFAEEMMNKLPNQDFELYYHISLTYSRLLMFVESNFYAEMAIEGYQKSLNYSKVTDCSMISAINYNFLGAHRVAERLFLNMLQGAGQYLGKFEESIVHHNLGYIYICLDKYEQSIEHLQTALLLKEENNISPVSTLYLLAKVYNCKQDKGRSWDFINQGKAKAVEEKDVRYIHKFYILKSVLEGTTKDDTFVKKLENEILPEFLSLNEFSDYKTYLKFLGDIYYEKRMYKKCAQLFKEANRYRRFMLEKSP